METKKTSSWVLIVLLILTWIIFIGLSIEASGFMVNAIFALVNPEIVPRLYRQVDLLALLNYDEGYFFTMTTVMAIIAMLKASLFYVIISMLHRKKLRMAQPFNHEVRRLIFLLSFLSLLIGLFSGSGLRYAEWLSGKGIQMPDSEMLRVGGADVWLFMAVILFVIAQVFKRGIEIQTENELTV